MEVPEYASKIFVIGDNKKIIVDSNIIFERIVDSFHEFFIYEEDDQKVLFILEDEYEKFKKKEIELPDEWSLDKWSMIYDSNVEDILE